MWKCASRKGTRNVFGVSIPDKHQVLHFMQSYAPTAYCEGYVEDWKNNTIIKMMPNNAVELDDLFWTRSDIYNFEKHDMKLCDDFLEEVRKRIA